MSSTSPGSTEAEKPPALRKTLGAVSPGFRGRADAEMHAIGLLYAAILTILLVPLLPFAAVLWVVWQVGGAVRSFVGEDESASGTSPGRCGRTT